MIALACVALLLLLAQRVHRDATPSRRQAAWDAHVADALAVSETDAYGAAARELAAGIDDEWQAAATTGWAAS